MNVNIKKNFFMLISVFILFFSLIVPYVTASASYEEAVRIFNEQSDAFLKDAKEAKDIVRILDEDSEANPDPPRNSISYVMKRLFYPGVYVNNVQDGILASELESDKSTILYNGKYACDPNTPSNLINHNCNIPNFTTGLVQSFADPFTPAFNNAEKTSSYSPFGLGVPNNIPGGIVPVVPSARDHTYTALELYGYNLKLTSYNGEWDNVIVSNQARMLSNFGVLDRITLTGTTMWNSIASGISTSVQNFSFNPVRWFSSIGKTFESAATAGINTLVDTSELNVVATNAWKRPRLDNTLYNAYVMTDAEVIKETHMNYFRVFSDLFDSKINGNPHLQEVVATSPTQLANVTAFVYDPQWETEESKAARAAAQKQRDADIAYNQAQELEASYSSDGHTPDSRPLTPIPEPVYYTEGEQLGFWAENPDVAKITGSAQKFGLIQSSPGGYETYEEMLADWETAYMPFFNAEFDALGNTVSEIIEENDSDVFLQYPHLDPKQSISKYACANEDGSMMRTENGSPQYLYLKNNTKGEEYLNPACKPVRDPIGAGLLGNGWDSSKISDTRHISHISEGGVDPLHKISSFFSNTVMTLNSFIAIVTNTILDLSFSPLMSELGITKIIEKFIEGFRDTVFFPLATIFAALGALLLFFETMRSGSLLRLLGTVAITLITFVLGAAFLLHPNAVMKTIDTFPSELDNMVADLILVDDDGSTYCSTGDAEDGIRSAQCNIWGAMVFEPWVHLQFGTGYSNLYAMNQKNPVNSESMKNTNGNLVGTAAVNMGGGEIINNWALYQLDVTKSGTINAEDKKNPVGTVDKNIYRLVDLQAGPPGSGTDSRYFKTWSGQDHSGLAGILVFWQALALLIAVGGIGLAKIEVSIMFALSVALLPVMLLIALIPKGQLKLKAYLSNLLSLLIRKVVLVVLLSVLLKMITLVYSTSDSIVSASVISIAASIAMIMYRKEITDLFSANNSGMFGADPAKFREALANSTPKGIRQGYQELTANLKGASAGFVGGAAGALEHKALIGMRRASISKELNELQDKLEKGTLDSSEEYRIEQLKAEQLAIEKSEAAKRAMTQEQLEDLRVKSKEIELKIAENDLAISNMINEDVEGNKEQIAMLSKENEDLEREKDELEIEMAGGVRESSSVFAQALKGSTHSKHLIGRRTERKLRTQGYAGLTAARDVREAVLSEGAKRISEGKESVEHDVYKDIMANSKESINKSGMSSNYDTERGQLESAKVQRYVRQMAETRRQLANENKTAITPENLKDLEKATKIVDRKRKLEKAIDTIEAPLRSYEAYKKDNLAKKDYENTTSSTADMIEQMDKHSDMNLEKINKEGKKVLDSRSLPKEITEEEASRQRSLESIQEKIDETRSKEEEQKYLYNLNNREEEENKK